MSGRKSGTDGKSHYRDFPLPAIPSVYSTSESKSSFISASIWKKYLDGEGVTDSLAILGVPRDQMEKNMSLWISCLDFIPLTEAQKDIDELFSSLESRMEAHPEDSLFFLRFTEMVSKYLYDPNSPLRDEDLYLPFVSRLAVSQYTREDMRPAYEYQSRMCSLNRRGSIAPDFAFTTSSGRRGSLNGIHADITVVLFSNPGCTSCREITEALKSRDYLSGLISRGRLAVLNIYIDEELAKWREYIPEYPRDWVNAYDHKGRIRAEQIYDVRAIPSLYLLDGEKRIIMKDAPLEKLLYFLDNYNASSNQ